MQTFVSEINISRTGWHILGSVTEEHKMPLRGYNLDVDAFVEFLQGGSNRPYRMGARYSQMRSRYG